MLRSKLIFLLKVSITLAILGYIFNTYIDIQVMSTLLGEIDYQLFVIVLLLHYIHRLFIAWQLKISLLPFNIMVSTYTVFKAHLISTLYSFVLPGDLAGGVTWYLLSKDNGRRAEVASVIIYLKGLNLITLIPFALLGLYFEPKIRQYNIHLYVLVTGGLLLAMLLPFFWSKAAQLAKLIMNYAIEKISPKQFSTRFREANENLWNSVEVFRQVPLSFVMGITTLSIITLGISIVLFYVMTLMVNIHLPLSAFAWLLAMMIVIHSLPLTIAGTGLREWSLIVVLKEFYSVPPESSLLFSVVSLLIAIFFGGILGGYYMMTFRKMN